MPGPLDPGDPGREGGAGVGVAAGQPQRAPGIEPQLGRVEARRIDAGGAAEVRREGGIGVQGGIGAGAGVGGEAHRPDVTREDHAGQAEALGLGDERRVAANAAGGSSVNA